MLEFVASLLQNNPRLFGKSLSITCTRVERADCLGSGRIPVSLPSIDTTSDMVGLSAALSCTHKRAT